MEFDRRKTLELMASVATVGVAGCTTPTDTNNERTTGTTDTISTSTTQTETATASSLSLASEVINQPSKDSPAKIRLSIVNQGEQAVQIGFGPALLYTDDSADSLSWADKLILDPDARGVSMNGEVRYENDCWRLFQNGPEVVQSSLEYREIPRSERLSQSYSVYTAGNIETCLPTGEYEFQDRSYLTSTSNPLTLSLTVQMENNQILSVSSTLNASTT